MTNMESDISLPGAVSYEDENISKTFLAGEFTSKTNIPKSAKRDNNLVSTSLQGKISYSQKNSVVSHVGAKPSSKNTEHSLRSASLQDLGNSSVTNGCNVVLCAHLSPSASTARRFAEAQSCKRWPNRRNALADPFQMAIPQVTREKIERDIIHRKTSVSKRLSQFFRSKIEPQPETDLT